MPIDSYSMCPGGTGKKIKFCCSDFVAELEKIERMMEGEQFQACVQHIERLQQEGRPRECLFAIKGEILRGTMQVDAARENAAQFVERFPANPVAWAESALLTGLLESGHAALAKLERAIVLSGRTMERRVYLAIGNVADVLTEEGDWMAARALYHLQLSLSHEDAATIQKLMRLNRSEEIPLLLKGEMPLATPPADAPWKARFEEALTPLQLAHWSEAVEKLSALAEEYPDAAAIWQSLAILRGWLANDEGAISAYRKLAELATSEEDASEAEATAMMLAKDPLGDSMDVVRLQWNVADQERLQERLLSDRRLAQVPFDPAMMAAEDSPPPRLVGLILDRPTLDPGAPLTLESIPSFWGQVFLFGRQTDQPARLEVVGVAAKYLASAKALVAEVGGDALDGEPTEEVVQQVSGSQHMLAPRWYPPADATREQINALAEPFYREAILEKWPQLPLGIFGGTSTLEAIADPANRARVMAAILVLEHWDAVASSRFDFNDLRERLGLPKLLPFDLAPAQIDALPLTRLPRVIVENISDDDLVRCFRRAMAFSVAKATRKFAQAVAERPTFAERPERSQAYQMLAQTAENAQQAIAHVEEGRRHALEAGRSCAPWDMLEISFRFGHGDVRAALALVQHIQQRHIEEPGIARALSQILIEVGLLRPDGTPAVPLGRRGGPMPGGEIPPAAAEPNKLWTPGDEGSGGGGGGKLWTPG